MAIWRARSSGKLRADADLAELERDTLLKDVAPIALFDQLVARMATGIKAIVYRSRLTDQEQYDIIDEIRTMLEDLDRQEYKMPESQAVDLSPTQPLPERLIT